MQKLEIENKRKNEEKVCDLMIRVFCKNVHKTSKVKNTDVLCENCKKLSEYVRMRIEKCPAMETKTFCSMCKIHCYKPEMREKIREVMRYSGPRMLLYHPLVAIKHLFLTVKEKINSK